MFRRTGRDKRERMPFGISFRIGFYDVKYSNLYENIIIHFDFYIMCMGVLSASMCVHHLHVWCPQRPERMLDPLDLELQI